MKRTPSIQQLFVTCAQGLEPLLVQELKELGIENLQPEFRGVTVEEAIEDHIYTINYCSRLASRVLLPISHFRCWDRDSLYHAARGIDWSLYLHSRDTFVVDANVNSPELRNSLFAALVVKDAICDQFRERTGERPSIDKENPTVRFNLFIQGKAGILSVDTSGASLNKRGYRLESPTAPLKETLAAALLRLAEYSGSEELLYDPCCGSGTLMIEAALIAAKIPPGYLRRQWGFMQLPFFTQQKWLKVKGEADQNRIELPPGKISGTDRDSETLRACRANLRAAGFLSLIEIQRKEFQDYIPSTPPTFLITNPPHGNRLDDIENLIPLYRALGDFMKRRMAKPSKGFIFVPQGELVKEIGLSAKRRFPLDNGGIDSRLLCFDIY